MSENKEIQELKEQIKNLKDIVTRLEQGETKYERPDIVLRRKKSEIYNKIFGKKKDVEDVHAYCVRRDNYSSSCTRIANQIFKVNRKCKTSDNIQSLVITDADIEEYCKIYERLLKTIIEEERKTSND